MTVWCATSNAGKLREFRMAASDLFAVEPLPNLAEIPPPAENWFTFEDNAIAKAVAYGRHTDGWLFADDAGLEVDALGGAPGVFSARFAGEHATDQENMDLLLERLGDTEDRVARFVSVIALVRDGQLVQTFRGTVEGRILYAPSGTGGFGYDPVFFFPSFGCTFAEAEPERKQSVSHRGKALHLMTDYLRDHN